MLRIGYEEIVAAEVHDNEVVVTDEADTVGPGREPVFSDRERNFGDQVGLVSLLDA